MNLRSVVVGLTLMFVAADASALASNEASLRQARANANAMEVTDTSALLTEIDEALEMARAGQYGNLKKPELVRLERARATIGNVLRGHSSGSELDADSRVALFNAQEEIRGILRSDEKNRKVCRRVSEIGSRVSTVECLTVAEREARTRAARDSARRVQRNVCTIGVANRPGEEVSRCEL